MNCYVIKTEKKQVKNGEEYFNRTFYLQGVGLSGMVPIRIVYFGKPVMEAVMEKLIDPATNRPTVGKDGKEVFVEKKDKDGNIIMRVKKDENGKDIVRDDDYRIREDLLDMFAVDLDAFKAGEVCKDVTVFAKKAKLENEEEKYYFFVKVGKKDIPIEVIDFSTDDRADFKYRSNFAKLQLLATNE